MRTERASGPLGPPIWLLRTEQQRVHPALQPVCGSTGVNSTQTCLSTFCFVAGDVAQGQCLAGKHESPAFHKLA